MIDHKNIGNLSLPEGTAITATLITRTESAAPFQYRLGTRNGVLVLQGCFAWQDRDRQGHEWRDLPTVEL